MVYSLRPAESWAHGLALPWVAYMNSNWLSATCTVLSNTVLWDELRPWTSGPCSLIGSQLQLTLNYKLQG